MKLRDHFMPESLLLSQFDILEEPVDAIKIDIRLSPSEIISNIVSLISKKVI
jgi:gluconate kinase